MARPVADENVVLGQDRPGQFGEELLIDLASYPIVDLRFPVVFEPDNKAQPGFVTGPETRMLAAARSASRPQPHQDCRLSHGSCDAPSRS
jgi:hypothetical protein